MHTIISAIESKSGAGPRQNPTNQQPVTTMACLNADGTLTASAQMLLSALASPASAADAAHVTGLPLFKVRSALREMRESALLAEEGGVYRLTEAGKARIAHLSSAH